MCFTPPRKAGSRMDPYGRRNLSRRMDPRRGPNPPPYLPESHQDFFRVGCFQEYYPDQMPERPNEEIRVRIRPNQANIPRELSAKLWNDHNMRLSPSRSDNAIIVVSGVPPNYGFGEHEIMQIVMEYAPDAEVVPQHRGRRR